MSEGNFVSVGVKEIHVVTPGRSAGEIPVLSGAHLQALRTDYSLSSDDLCRSAAAFAVVLFNKIEAEQGHADISSHPALRLLTWWLAPSQTGEEARPPAFFKLCEEAGVIYPELRWVVSVLQENPSHAVREERFREAARRVLAVHAETFQRWRVEIGLPRI